MRPAVSQLTGVLENMALSLSFVEEKILACSYQRGFRVKQKIFTNDRAIVILLLKNFKCKSTDKNAYYE
jgi:hypothetical protein